MKDRLEKIADAADALEDANRRVAKSLDDRKAIVADHARLRENLRVAPAVSDLAKVATRKLLDQETQLEHIDAETKSTTDAQAAARASSRNWPERPPRRNCDSRTLRHSKGQV
jgi:MoxR-like ATPase